MSLDLAVVGETALTGFVITGFTSPLVLQFLRHADVMDIPSLRSSHVETTPRGGGLACALGLLVTVAVVPGLGASTKLLYVTSGGCLAALGFADDLHSMKVRLRFGIQIVVALIASCWAIDVPQTKWVSSLALAGICAAWIVTYVNVFNFMDGINGLAGAATVVGGLNFVVVGLDRHDAAVALAGAAMAGPALAFLPWNFPHARFFLGDVGSYLLGGMTAVVAVVGIHAHLPLEALIGPEALLLADTGWTLAGRICRREDWTTPHRSHVYQRLQGDGGSHVKVTALISALTIATAMLGLVSLIGELWFRLIADGTGIILVGSYLLSPRFVRLPARAP